MSTLRIVYPSGLAKAIEPPQQVDHLFELRAPIRKSQEPERQMTAEILGTMQATGLEQLEGQQAVAIAGERVNLVPDVQLFLEALGDRAFEAMTVKVEAARQLLGEQDLRAISETTTSPVLRVEPRRKVA